MTARELDLKMRCESLRSTHQGASKCPEKQKRLFKDRDGGGSKGPSQWVPPTLQPVNSASPEATSEGVLTHPFTRKDTDFSSSQKNVGLEYESPPSSLPCPLSLALETWWGWRGDLTNRCESFDLLKMLMGKRRTPGSITMLTWLEMCLDLCRAMWHIYQAISLSCWVSLRMQQARGLLGIVSLVFNGKILLSLCFFCSTIYYYRLCKQAQICFSFGGCFCRKEW